MLRILKEMLLFTSEILFAIWEIQSLDFNSVKPVSRLFISTPWLYDCDPECKSRYGCIYTLTGTGVPQMTDTYSFLNSVRTYKTSLFFEVLFHKTLNSESVSCPFITPLHSSFRSMYSVDRKSQPFIFYLFYFSLLVRSVLLIRFLFVSFSIHYTSGLFKLP